MVDKKNEKYGIFVELSLFLCSIFSIVSYLLFSLQRPSDLEGLDYYLLALLVLVLFLMFPRGLRQIRSFKTSDTAIFAIFVFFVTFLTSFFVLNASGLATDELNHIYLLKRYSIVRSGYWQQNPPLLGLFVSPLLNWIEGSAWVVRLPSALFGSLASVCFLLILRQMKLSIFLAALFTILFACHPVVEIYRREARPVSLGLFLLLLFLMAIKSAESERFSFSSLTRVYCSLFLAVFAIGFQPLALGAGVGFYSLLSAIRDPKYLRLSFCLLVPVVLFIPIQQEILNSSPVNIRSFFLGDIGPLVARQFRFETYASVLEYFVFPYMPLMIPFLISGPRYWGPVLSYLFGNSNFQLLMICLITLIFFFLPFFHAYSNGNFQVYYLLIIYPIVLLFVAWFWARLSELKGELGRRLMFAFLVIYICTLVQTKANTPISFYDSFRREDVRPIADQMATDANKSGSFYFIELCPWGSERPCHWAPFYVDVYFVPKLSKIRKVDSIFLAEEHFLGIKKNFEQPLQVEYLYIFFQEMPRKQLLRFMSFLRENFRSEDIYIWSHEKHSALKVPVEERDARYTLISALKKILKFCDREKSDCLWIRAALLAAHSGKGDINEARRILKDEVEIIEKKFEQSRPQDIDLSKIVFGGLREIVKD